MIGAGGFGVTYAALDEALGRRVAIKEYFPAGLGRCDPAGTVGPSGNQERRLFEHMRAGFLREARTLSRFEHPAIVSVSSVFEALGTAYIVMRYEEGRSLKAWLDGLGRKPTTDELLRLVVPLCEALEQLHAADYLHRDIAPDNIIIRPDGSPVLIDFGAARQVLQRETAAVTGLIKQGYSPLEQYATDSRMQGSWTDLYALAATLYHCVTGAKPIDATTRQLEDELAPAAVAAKGQYPETFLAAIDRVLALRPEARPQSIGEWRAMLLAGDGPHLKAAPAVAAGPHPPPADPPLPQPPAAEASGQLPRSAFALAVLAGLGGACRHLLVGWPARRSTAACRHCCRRAHARCSHACRRQARCRAGPADADRRAAGADRQPAVPLERRQQCLP